MSNSTNLLGPYDHLTTSEKTAIACAIPHDVKSRLFDNLLPLRGSCDKVLTRIIFILDGYAQLHPTAFDGTNNELLVNSLFNSITNHLRNTPPAEL